VPSEASTVTVAASVSELTGGAYTANPGTAPAPPDSSGMFAVPTDATCCSWLVGVVPPSSTAYAAHDAAPVPPLATDTGVLILDPPDATISH